MSSDGEDADGYVGNNLTLASSPDRRTRMTTYLLAGLLTVATTADALEPYISHVVDAAAGQTMVISGGGFDPRTVRALVYIPGNLTSEGDGLPATIASWAATYDGRMAALPDVPLSDKSQTLVPIHATARSVFVTLPAHPYPPNYVAIVWLEDDQQLSRPMLVNQPNAWFLLKGVSRPGEMNRLCGFNLRGDRYVPRYLFLRKRGESPIRLDESPRHHEDGFSENFCVQFRLPNDLEPGDYEVFLHNNSGGRFGFTTPLPLQVTDEPDFPERLFIATEYGMQGDSVTDNRDALQQLLDMAGEAGGGVVFLPPGAYRVNDTIQMRQHVILRGAGRDATTLFFGGKPHEKKRYPWFMSARGVDHTGLEDLTLRVSYPMEYAVSYYAGGEPTHDTHLTRCRFVGGAVGVHYNINAEVGHCSFEGGRFHATNLRNAWIHDNQFTVGRFGGNPVSFWASENCTIEHNRAYKSNRGFVWQIHGEFGHYHNLIDANVVEDARFGGNAGETYLFEGSGFQWFGAPSAIDADGFFASSANWEQNSLKDAFAVVTAGRGVGQYRRIRSNDATRVNLAESWRITPSGDVRISILRGVVENAICNNRHVDCDNSMMFYGCGLLNNRITRNRSENSLGISVWSYAEAEETKLIPDYYNVFDGNVFEDQGGVWMTRRGDLKQETGVRALNNVFRNSLLADVRRKRENQYGNVWEETRHGSYRPVQAAFWCDIGRSYHADPTQSPIWLDTLIERNYITRCTRGIELRKISGGTVIHQNTFFDVDQPVFDSGEGTVQSNNREEWPESRESTKDD